MPLSYTERKTQPKEDKRKRKTVILTGFPHKLHLQATLEEKEKKNDGKKAKDGQKKNKPEGKINESKKRQHYKDTKKQ